MLKMVPLIVENSGTNTMRTPLLMKRSQPQSEENRDIEQESES